MSFNRADYEKIILIARQLHQPVVTRTLRKQLAVELFEMAEDVIGQQTPPLNRSENNG